MLPSTLFKVCYMLSPMHRRQETGVKTEKQLVLLALMKFVVGVNYVLFERAFFLCYPVESTNLSSNILTLTLYDISCC